MKIHPVELTKSENGLDVCIPYCDRQWWSTFFWNDKESWNDVCIRHKFVWETSGRNLIEDIRGNLMLFKVPDEEAFPNSMQIYRGEHIYLVSYKPIVTHEDILNCIACSKNKFILLQILKPFLELS